MMPGRHTSTRVVGGSAPWIALFVLGVMLLGAAWTVDPDSRMGRVSVDRTWEAPSLSCPSGRDRNGRCVAMLMAGGVHSFLWSGLAAALATGVLGTTFGLLAGHPRSPVSSLVRTMVHALEALPRLVMLIIVYVLWNQRPEVIGLTLGILLAPTLASEVQMRLAGLEQSDFLQATRAHGVSESRVIWFHCLYLSCRGEILRRMVFAFGQMVMMDTAMSYVMKGSISSREVSWGQLLRDLSGAIYDSIWAISDYLLGKSASLQVLGVPQLLFLVSGMAAVVWATSLCGEYLSRRVEVER